MCVGERYRKGRGYEGREGNEGKCRGGEGMEVAVDRAIHPVFLRAVYILLHTRTRTIEGISDKWMDSYLSVPPAACLMLISIQLYAPGGSNCHSYHLLLLKRHSVVSVQRRAVQAADELFTLL